jgi:hypothetical protein
LAYYSVLTFLTIINFHGEFSLNNLVAGECATPTVKKKFKIIPMIIYTLKKKLKKYTYTEEKF